MSLRRGVFLVNLDVVKNWKGNIKDIISEYDESNIFNCDKTACAGRLQLTEVSCYQVMIVMGIKSLKGESHFCFVVAL